MLIKKVLASYTFRFILVYVTGLSFGVLVILSLVYATLSYDYFQRLDERVQMELDAVADIYQTSGSVGVRSYVRDKNSLREADRYYYLLVDSEYRKQAGNLDSWPTYRHHGDGWLSFQIDVLNWEGREVDTDFFARTKDLANGDHLLVARHYGDVVHSASLVGGVLVRTWIVTIILGAVGGFVVGAKSVEQLDKINRTLHRIMSGNLSERINEDRQRGELKELATNVNNMLDRIQMLMEGMLQVTDNIAHDLRTPLTRLRNHLSDLQERLVDEPAGESVGNLIEEADAILATFGALLRIARVEAGNRRSAFATVDPRVILLDVIELYEPLAMEKSISLSQNLVGNLRLEGDRDLLFQALANLIDNAIKYTPEGGNILIEMGAQDGRALLSVADTGCGIPEADRSKVFRRFYRVESSRSEQPGNGLGLSLVWAVVKLHNGNITLSDNHPGLRVTVSLPLSE